MIHSVTANHASFRSVSFKPGFNVVLAERNATSTQKDTRNGVGKSTLLDIIDFCLGSKVKRGQGLSIAALQSWAFTLEVTLAGKRVFVTRAVASPNRFVVRGSMEGWIEEAREDPETGERYFDWESWKRVLGWALFGLCETEAKVRYKPSYRSLVSYFLRRGQDAYLSPFSHFRQQKTWDIQLHIAYLLGLNWENVSKWQELKDQNSAVKAFDQAVKTGFIEGNWGSIGELEAERVRLEALVEVESRALESFKVHPQYSRIQDEADQSTAELHKLTNDNLSDRRLLTLYRESIAREKSPPLESFEKLYKDTGLVFPDSVKKTLEEARDFHIKILENRRTFLSAEVEQLERKIENREKRIKELTILRSEVLETLRTHKALDEFVKHQEQNAQLRRTLASVQSRLSDLKNRKSKKRDIKVQLAQLTKSAEQDHEERREIWTLPVQLFSSHSLALYNAPGSLAIDVTESGLKYDVEISRSGSDGIEKMKIFCFDLTVLQGQLRSPGRIDFLVHDSLLFDGVDERQRALALERACQVVESAQAQYLCVLNSDMIPRSAFSPDFDFDQYVRLTLSDKSAEDRLLGFEFERAGRKGKGSARRRAKS